MRIVPLILALTCFLAGCAGSGEITGGYQLYLVRHAEKQANAGSDPHLTAAGQQRALKLADYLEKKSVRDIWSSDYFRTRETALPLSESIGRTPAIYDPHDLESLAGKLLKAKNNALVVGHSNTTPELARLLCKCDIEDMDDAEYDRLIVVTVANGGVRVTTLRQDALSR